ncbi:MAG: tetratricopeptide repeat protein [bacterium]|nr:tetratricopeptide repeat protein [bacterium]
MHGIKVLLLLLMIVSLGLVITGCKDSIPESDLDQFIVRMEALDSDAKADSLQAIANGGGASAPYAKYMQGNSFYTAAADSARLGGWGSGGSTALLDSAETYFSAAVAMDSSFVEAIVNLGSLWDDRSEQLTSRDDRKTKVDQAEKFYRLALDVSPTDEKARCNLGSLYLRQRRVSDAKNEFMSVLENNPRSSLAHYNLAIMFAEAKIYREAIAEWELAVKYDPDGDIGQRSEDNIKIVKDLMNTPLPGGEKKSH